jgi:subtilisin family serine protease
MKKILAVLVGAVAIFAGPPRVAQTQATQLQFVADEILIRFRQSATAAERAEARSWVGGARRRLIRRHGTDELELATTSGRSVEAAALLRTHPAVAYAEPNWIYTHQATSDDPFYIDGSLWGMLGDTTAPANQFGSQAGEAWRAEHVGSASIYVGVIDEGIDLNHRDLASNIWTNPFDPVDGVDNDGNGYVDDVHGWDFSLNNNSIYDGSPSDSATDSHGTHVSGIIGGVGGNSLGVAGVNWNVTMISAKFLGPNGGTTANAISAIDYITDLKTRHGLNIVATNNSWGGGGYSQALHDAIIRAANADILFVAAAGNGNFFGLGLNNDTTPYYPSNYNTAAGTPTQPAARYDAVISVASITSTGAKSAFSNYGTTTVDLGAPGSGIWSTTPNNGYRSFSGTSMATPYVAGAAALYASLHPLAPASDIKSALLALAVATSTASLTMITVTNGRLNIRYFAGPPPPLRANPPSDLSAPAVSSGQISIHTWRPTSVGTAATRT